MRRLAVVLALLLPGCAGGNPLPPPPAPGPGSEVNGPGWQQSMAEAKAREAPAAALTPP
jgi:hypothetical protein